MTESDGQAYAWDTAQLGDALPDPGWPCGVPDPDRTWVCTRAAGHRPGSPHVATANGVVVAVWAGTVPSPPRPTADVVRGVGAQLRAEGRR